MINQISPIANNSNATVDNYTVDMPCNYKPSVSMGVYGSYKLNPMPYEYKPSHYNGNYGVYTFRCQKDNCPLHKFGTHKINQTSPNKSNITVDNCTVDMPCNYKPSVSMGVYGSYKLNPMPYEYKPSHYNGSMPYEYKPSHYNGNYGVYTFRCQKDNCPLHKFGTHKINQTSPNKSNITVDMPCNYKPSVSMGVYGSYKLNPMPHEYKPSHYNGNYGVYTFRCQKDNCPLHKFNSHA
eukprot:132696_1